MDQERPGQIPDSFGGGLAEEGADRGRVRLQREMAGVVQVHFGVRDVPAIGLGAGRQEERIVPAPDGQQRRPPRREVGVDLTVVSSTAIWKQTA
jgi:hypothetical protein